MRDTFWLTKPIPEYPDEVDVEVLNTVFEALDDIAPTFQGGSIASQPFGTLPAVVADSAGVVQWEPTVAQRLYVPIVNLSPTHPGAVLKFLTTPALYLTLDPGARVKVFVDAYASPGDPLPFFSTSLLDYENVGASVQSFTMPLRTEVNVGGMLAFSWIEEEYGLSYETTGFGASSSLATLFDVGAAMNALVVPVPLPASPPPFPPGP